MRFSTTEDTRENYQAYLRAYGDAVSGCVQFLDDAMKEVAKCDSPHDIAVLLLTRHAVESIDAVAILLSHGVVDPCEPHLRSTLEAALGINYILETDNERRGLAYVVADYRKHLLLHRKFDPDDPVGKEIRADNTDEQIDALIGTIPSDTLRNKLDFLRAQLCEPEFNPINDEFDRLKAAAKKPCDTCPTCGRSDLPSRKGEPKWYSLFGGQRSVKDLARHFKLNYLYEFMFDPWSGAIHGSNSMRNLCDNGDSLGYRSLRHPDGMNRILRACMVVALPLATQLFLAYSSLTKDDVMKRHKDLCEQIHVILETENVSWDA